MIETKVRRMLFNKTRQFNIQIFDKIKQIFLLTINMIERKLKRTLFNKTRQFNIQIFDKIIFLILVKLPFQLR